MLFIPVI